MTTKRTLLIDGDTIAFLAASVCQHTVESPDGFIQPFARRREGEAVVDNLIVGLKHRLSADDAKVFLSCPPGQNFRYRVFPAYKANRKKSVRPLLLQPLRDYLRHKYDATHLAGCEADDAIGIHATMPSFEGERVVVGRDKDFQTIPGLHYQLKDDNEAGTAIIREWTPEQCERYHMAQTLAGDPVDGYPGCPGIGMARALPIVQDPRRLVPKQGVITRGKNKGEKTVKWIVGEPCSMWQAVIWQFVKAGLGVGEALQSARLSKILLSDNYDMENRRVILWEPPAGDTE